MTKPIFAVLFYLAVAPWSVVAGSSSPTIKAATWTPIEDSLGRYGDLTVDEARHRLLAPHVADGTLDIIDLDHPKVIARIPVGLTTSVAVDKERGIYFASVPDDNRIAVVDARSFREIGSIVLPESGGNLLFEPKHRRLYVADSEAGSLWVVETDTRKITGTIALPESPECLAYDSASSRLYATVGKTNQVAVIDPQSGTVLHLWPTGPAVHPHGLALDVAQGRLLVAGVAGQLVAMDLRTGKIITFAAIKNETGQIAYDPLLQLLYCAAPDWIIPVQCSGHSLLPLEPVYSAPTSTNVAIDPQTHDFWAAFTDGEDVYFTSWTVK